MEEKKMELSTNNENATLAAQFTARGAEYCSLDASTPESKAVLFSAMNNPDFRVDEKLNTTIRVADVYAEAIQLVDDDGVLTDSIRIVLIDDEGHSYGCCSVGMFSALKKLMLVYGEPTWNPPIAIQPYQQKTRNGNNKVLTFRIVNE